MATGFMATVAGAVVSATESSMVTSSGMSNGGPPQWLASAVMIATIFSGLAVGGLAILRGMLEVHKTFFSKRVAPPRDDPEERL